MRSSPGDVPEESWSDPARGRIRFRTLIGDRASDTDSLSAGISELSPGGWLARHRHQPAEVYHVLDGAGIVEVDGAEHHVGTGATVFIPGGHWHAARNPGPEPFRVFYAFAVDSFADVHYEFAHPDAGQPGRG